MTAGRCAAQGKSIEEEDLDIPIPLMVFEESGDVPETRVTVGHVVIPSADTYHTDNQIMFGPGGPISRASVTAHAQEDVQEPIEGDNHTNGGEPSRGRALPTPPGNLGQYRKTHDEAPEGESAQ